MFVTKANALCLDPFFAAILPSVWYYLSVNRMKGMEKTKLVQVFVMSQKLSEFITHIEGPIIGEVNETFQSLKLLPRYCFV